MYIETKRLIIRDFAAEDVNALHLILGDAETMQYSEPAYSFEKTADFLEEFCIKKRGAVAAVLKDSGKLIGYLLFHATEKDVYELGWFFNRAYWQQGYASEACKGIISYAFRELNAHKIFAETIDAVKSTHLMEKLGMKAEGVQKSQTKNNRGVWADLYFYGLLKEDWTPSLYRDANSSR